MYWNSPGRAIYAATGSTMDLTEAWKTVDELAQTFVAAIPRFVLAIVLALFFYVVGRVVRALIEKGSHDDEISRRTLVMRSAWSSPFSAE